MQARGSAIGTMLLGTFFALSCQLLPQTSSAAPLSHQRHVSNSSQIHTAGVRLTGHGKFASRGHQYARGGGISCVPFARSDSGIAVSGNAWQWWDNAAGVYARGSVPEPGSVLTFRANGRMHLGHVAVVSRVINPREVEIEHANWWGPGAYGGVARNVPVVDVSEANDWTAVRVGLGQSGEFGSVYPTYGFIYDRPDSGVMVASSRAPTPQPDLNPPPRDLRPASERGWQTYEEVAEAPAVAKHGRRLVAVSTHHVHRVAMVPHHQR